jgi:hypothetical protein
LYSTNEDIRSTVDRINKRLAKLSDNLPVTTEDSENSAAGETVSNNMQTGENGMGSGTIPNEDIYTAKAKNYADYDAELDNNSDSGNGAGQKAYIDGEKGEVVHYSEVFNEYKNEAISAIEKENIPYGVRNLVRDYFSSLE